MTTATHSDFTPRQLEIARYVAEGLSCREIGPLMGITPRTVKAHADVLRQKLGVPRMRHIPAAMRALGIDVMAAES